MKTNEILLVTASLTSLNCILFSQKEIIPATPESKSDQFHSMNPNVFKVFTGGVNALYSNNRTMGGIDLSVQTYHYFLVTGKQKELDSTTVKVQKNYVQQYNGFDFFLLNRAAVDFDSSSSMASDYLSSLQASPLTLRFVKELFLTDQREITSTSYSPVVSIKLTGDSRLIPYNYRTGQTNVGASANFFVSFSTQFTRLEFDHKGKEIDRGTMYFQPSFGFALGNEALMKSVLINPKDKIVLASECRLGFRSHTKTVNDCCFLIRYAINDLIGPKLRAGVILSSLN